jgi:hypothetical protein
VLHFAAGGVGFLCLAIACFVLARRFAPTFSRATGVLFLAGFAAIATGGPVLAFTAAILLAWTWLSTTSFHYYTNN